MTRQSWDGTLVLVRGGSLRVVARHAHGHCTGRDVLLDDLVL
jgi:hypothetical protein